MIQMQRKASATDVGENAVFTPQPVQNRILHDPYAAREKIPP